MTNTMNKLTTTAKTDIRHHLHSQTNLQLHNQVGPLVITRGDGVHVYDESGKKYVEGMSGLWCAALGFSNTRLADVATRQLAKLPNYHTFNHRVPDVVAALAEKIAGIAPMPDAKIFFASSGSEANDTQVKIAWYYQAGRGKPAKRKILAHTNGFHGSTVMGASLSGLPHMHASFGLPLPGIVHLECPHYYKQGQPGESEEAFVARLIRQLEEVIAKEGADTIAAFIAEPVMGAGGVIVPPAGYFKAFQEVLKKHDILMLADEIICGFGRTGNWFGSQTMEFLPDMMACAKTITSGYLPLSCVAVSGEIFDVLQAHSGKIGPFGHGFTYSGHPVAAAVALEALTMYEEMDAPRLTAELGKYLHERLAALDAHPLVGEIRGVGFMAGVELVKDKQQRIAFDSSLRVGAEVEKRLRNHGVILRNMGDAIAISPPFISTRENIDAIVDALTLALNEITVALEIAA